MTEAELTRLEALAAAATPGPWNNQGVIVLAGEDTCIARLWLTHPAKGSEETNAAFIAASRKAVPALVAEVRRLREALTNIKNLPGELNLSNYNSDDVDALNNAHIEAFQIARAALEGK